MKIVIEGAGEVGRHLAQMFCEEGYDVTVIGRDQDRLKKMREQADVVTLLGKPSSIKTLKEAGVEKAELFISVNPTTAQDVNIVSATIAKQLGAKKVICRIDDEDYLSPENKLLFKSIGIDMMFYPEKIAAVEIVSMLKRSASTDSIDFANGKIKMEVFKLEEGSPIIDMTLLDLVGKFKTDGIEFRVVAVSNHGYTIMPKPDYQFSYHDVVFIIAKKDDMTKIMEYLGKDNVEVNKVMILGAGTISEIVTGQLSRRVENVKVIDTDVELCRSLARKVDSKVTVVTGDGRNSDFLLEQDIRSYDAFMALTENDEANILACVAAKKLGVARTVAEVENLEYINLAKELGVDYTINKKLLTANRIYKQTLSSKSRMVKSLSGTEDAIIEYTVAKGSRITKAPLKDINFPSDAIIAGVARGRDAFIALGSTQIEDFDKVVVFSLPSCIKEVDKLFI